MGTSMIVKRFAPRALLSVLAAGIAAGCSSMQPTPMMPTEPAIISSRDGVTAEQDAVCRKQAYDAAEKAKNNNIAKEVGVTAVGIIAGAVLGNALEPRGFSGPAALVPAGGPGPRGPGAGGRPGGRPGGGGPRGPSGPSYGTAGGIAGAAVGAAASQSMLQDTQQVYDITYTNCVTPYASANAESYSNGKRKRRR